jgi:hypothetical protein
MRRLIIGAFFVALGCGGTTGADVDSGPGDTKDAGADSDVAASAGSTGGAGGRAGTGGGAGTSGGAGGRAGTSGGAAGSGGSVCDTVCAHADACCVAVSVAYGDGLDDHCSYQMSCETSQGATSDACTLYLKRLPTLLLPSMPLPDACKSTSESAAAP